MHRRVGAQLLVGLASYPQSMLPTDPVVSLHEYTLLLGTGNARTCRIPGDVLWPKERVRFCMMVVARCSWRRCWHPGPRQGSAAMARGFTADSGTLRMPEANGHRRGCSVRGAVLAPCRVRGVR